MTRAAGGPTRPPRPDGWTVTFDQDVTDAQVEEFVRQFRAARAKHHAAFEPVPEFAECGRSGCDLREKRLEHGHFGDRQPPFLVPYKLRPRHFDRLGRRVLAVLITVAAATAGATMLLRELLQ